MFKLTILCNVVVMACCHSGMINTLSCIREITGQQKIRVIIGGFHLLTASEQRLRSTFAALREIAHSLPLYRGTGHEDHAGRVRP